MSKTHIAIMIFALAASGSWAASNTSSDRMHRVESDVLPEIIPKGVTRKPTSLTRRMADLKVPGVSAAMIHNGRIEWANGAGKSSLTASEITPDTLFQAGSISKSVTALAVLRLVQAGKLNLDADVNSYLRGWKIPKNQFTSKQVVTLRELLSHTAGTTVHGFEGYKAGDSIPSLVQILDGATPANSQAVVVVTVPGTAWRYSGGGYVIVQKVLEDVTGKAFPELMKEEVLDPIGMSHSTFAQPLPSGLQRYAAEPYDEDGKMILGGAHTYPEMAAAGLWTTPSDLAKFLLGIQASLAGQPNSILSQSLAKDMVKRGGLGQWGLGVQLGGNDTNPFFQHGGVDSGFVSFIIAYNQGDGLVIMTNSMNGGVINNELLRAVAREYDWPNYQPKFVTGRTTPNSDLH